MIKKVFIFCCLVSAIIGNAQTTYIDFNKNGKMDVFENPMAPIDDRINDLLSQMTIDEKTCQLATLYGYGRVLKEELPTPEWKNEVWKDGIANIDEHLNGLAYHDSARTKYSFPFSGHVYALDVVQKWFVEQTRLGIPVDFSNEGIHGLNHDRATPLPAPIAIGSTWDKALVRQAGEIVGREAKLLGYTNVYTPILDMARDPRWGRVVECYGEDPFLVAELGKQMVLGVQSNPGVASTLKHFALYSMPKGGRDGYCRTDPHIAPKEMHQIYLYPFRRVIEEAHPMGVMSSYNDWDGEPITGSYYFLTELLRHQFGFDGYVVSDSEAVEFLFTKHKVADTYKEAVRQCIEAGLNVRTNFTPPEDYIFPARELVKEGKISMKTLDSRVSDVLRVKFKLGLFDNPYTGDSIAATKEVGVPHHKDFILQMARESLVLLKNEKQTLPLKINQTKKILITGPLAKATNYAISRYGPSNLDVISVYDGIKQYVGNKAKIEYAKGCDVVDANWPESEIIPTPLTPMEKKDIDIAVAEAKKSDVIIAVMGEDEKRVGESLSRTGLGLPGKQLELLQALHETGKPVVLVLINGRPLTINWENRYLPAILEAWFPNCMGGQAIAETLFGENDPGGKLTVTFPKTIGQIELNFPFKPGSHAGQPGDGPNGFGNTAVVGALYPFGFGLSYTSFSYANLTVDPKEQFSQGNFDVYADITNTGNVAGDEVVQLYIKKEVSSVTTYEMQLRGFERVTLKPKETKKVHFILQPSDLEIMDKDMHYVVEPGKYDILIGSSSEKIELSTPLLEK
jgi:beta-glucosidase